MNIVKKIMISCDEATLLASKLMENELSFFQKLKLKLHNRICPPCHRFLTQIKSIHKALRNKAIGDNISLSDDKKKSLQKIIETNL